MRCATVDEKQSRRTIAAAAVPPVCGPLVPRLRSVKETIRAAAPAAVDEQRAMRADERRTTRKLLCQSASGEELSDTAIRPSVPWRSCLGYRHACCLQLNHRRPPEMRGLRTRPRMDVDPARFLPPSNCHWQRAYRLAASGAIPSFCKIFINF